MKKVTIIGKIKRRNKTQSADKLWNLKRHIPTGKFVIVAKFDDHVLHHLASSLSTVIKQAGRQTKVLSCNNCFKD